MRLINLFYFVLFLLTAIACKNETNFDSKKGVAPRGTIPDGAGVLPPTNPLYPPTGPNPTPPIFTPPPPSNAVTKGSFTVWANPATPMQGQEYKIYIEVKLPSSINYFSYTKADLSGCVIGTDQYLFLMNRGEYRYTGSNQTLPITDCSQQGSISSTQLAYRYFDQETFSSSPGKATLVIRIPGAQRNVRDTITVSSRLLNETQTISLYFN